MEWLIDLWLPVVVITPVLFIASFLAWVVLPHHKPDIRRWPDEDRLLEFVRQSGAEPGEYLFPLIDDKDMREDWAQKRYEQGPWGVVNVWAGQPNMAGNMVKTVVYFLIVTLLIAYAGHAALAAGSEFGEVFQVVGTMAILAYVAGGVLREIWFTRPLRAKLMDALDGLVFGVITGVLFALMWP